ncbi:FKBP-type peptidyl prolyl cis-trans isomerase [Mariprofundus aestuarium]|uniref:Peptidyl-prolyl cis-trans isomerase n=1 Tax=Mariprofundus aestuarium TaxID=1921086 RepID=A0A2K8KXW2_MARES|nr:peptidylprolyl isomerase [Mariprofundus aestuarium]ATX79787.1 FKBP-type peptidyl prolyl cis-trans isomerase [Mariprofundus aestuarium]
MQITDHKVVSFHYTLTNDAREVLDTTTGGEPLPYLHGEENIVPGLELALEGKSVGDKLKVSLDAADAYGELDPALIEVVSADLFEGIETLEAGMEFETESDDGEVEFVRITAIDGDNVTIDGNHPLAGQNLTFDVEITDIRDATEEELEHGHVHGDDEGCCGDEDCCS